jgi:AmmeMemoRadiSam system protein A
MIVGTPDLAVCAKFGKALAAALKGKNALIVASSDLSHYPDYDDAVNTDKNTLAVIATMNSNAISEKMNTQLNAGIKSLVTCACGEAPILALISTVKELGGNYASVISYANSGNTFVGSKNRVVGYGAVAFYKTGQNSPTNTENKMSTDMNTASELSKHDKKVLLQLARRTIEQYLNSETLPLPTDLTPAMESKRGAFVTLRKNKQLRGCIGNMSEEFELCNVIGRMALSAAFNDTRFQPVELREMPEIEIEISVLTPIAKVDGPGDIVLGRDGVIINKGGKQAVYLPQVATETGWDKETFLTQLCYKAGLNANDWKSSSLYTFKAEVFSESDFK